MDLRTSFPRSMRVTLGGYVHLARMIDKCRAVLAGTEGEYIYPCPLDKRLMEFAGVTAEQFTEAVTASRTDEEMIAWFQRTATPRPQSEVDQWNRALLLRGPSSTDSQKRFDAYRDAVDPSRTDLTSWADLQDLEEGRDVPCRQAANSDRETY
nr:DUF5069 domain-containing protein [Nitrospira japonica]